MTHDLAHCCVAKEMELFNRYGLSASEGHVLLTVAEAGRISPSIVANRLGVGRSRLTPLAQALVDKGFVTRNESSADRRVRDLTLTHDGRQIAHDAAKFRLEFHQRLLEGLPDSMRERMIETLYALHERMNTVRCELLEPSHNGHGTS
ncbi:MarR family transcriptional regulator [bacterium]|nr:MarR family transcriptional regulator [bacterium]